MILKVVYWGLSIVHFEEVYYCFYCNIQLPFWIKLSNLVCIVYLELNLHSFCIWRQRYISLIVLSSAFGSKTKFSVVWGGSRFLELRCVGVLRQESQRKEEEQWTDSGVSVFRCERNLGVKSERWDKKLK